MPRRLESSLEHRPRIEKLLFLDFVLWCFSRSSFIRDLTDSSDFQKLSCIGYAFSWYFTDFTSAGYAISIPTHGIQPSVLALLRGAHKFGFPRIADLMIKMLSLDVECAVGLQTEQMHLQWEMLMRQVWHHQYELNECESRIRLTFFYGMETDYSCNHEFYAKLKELRVDVSQPPCDPLREPKDLRNLAHYFNEPGPAERRSAG